MDKRQKELAKSYYRARLGTIAAVADSMTHFEFYEMEFGLKNKFITYGDLDKNAITDLLLVRPELIDEIRPQLNKLDGICLGDLLGTHGELLINDLKPYFNKLDRWGLDMLEDKDPDFYDKYFAHLNVD